MSRPNPTEYAPDYESYVRLVPEEDVTTALETQSAETRSLLDDLSEAQGVERHAPYTWSIKEVVGHVTDAERVFAYRAMRFARGDSTPLPGFDENAYVKAAAFDRIPLKDLVAEFEAVRHASVSFFQTLSAADWAKSGLANDNRVTVRALAYIIVGHARHHTAILRRRLGKA
jgi:hypothetical protein